MATGSTEFFMPKHDRWRPRHITSKKMTKHRKTYYA